MTDRPLALVTGGSSGIGYELAAQLAHRGYDVAISGQSERVHDSAKELEALGVEAYPFRADAATYDGVEGFWTFVATDSGFHANAGMGDTVFGDNS